MYSGSDDLEELEDRVRDLAGLLAHLTTVAAFADRTADRRRDPAADLTRRKVIELTHAVGALGHALADLGDTVAHAGILHQLAAAPSSARRSTAIDSTRAVLHARIDSARVRLNKAGARLHQEADQLTNPGPLQAGHEAPARLDDAAQKRSGSISPRQPPQLPPASPPRTAPQPTWNRP